MWLTKGFSFDFPGVNPGETAFMMFQSRDVDHQTILFQINGVDVLAGYQQALLEVYGTATSYS